MTPESVDLAVETDTSDQAVAAAPVWAIQQLVLGLMILCGVAAVVAAAWYAGQPAAALAVGIVGGLLACTILLAERPIGWPRRSSLGRHRAR
jgi:hypothetical protein